MAALTTERKKTDERVASMRQPGVSAAVKCYAGGIAVLNGGYAEPGTTARGLVAIGRFEETVDNTDGNDGDVTVRVKRGCFRFGNSAAADAISADDIGEVAYIVDDQTVALTHGGSTRSIAGKIFDVDADGVWVEIGSTPIVADEDLVVTGDITAGDDLFVTDDATISGDLAVTGNETIGGTLSVIGNVSISDAGAGVPTLTVEGLVRGGGLRGDDLTAGRVPYNGADGRLKDEAGFEYNEGTNTLAVPNATLSGDVDAAGGFRTAIGPFVAPGAAGVTAADQTNLDCRYGHTVTAMAAGFVATRAGSIVGISAMIHEAITGAGTSIVVKPTVNGVEVNLPASLTQAGAETEASADVAKGTHAFVAGDVIGLSYTSTTITNTPALVGSLIIEQ